MLGAQLCSRALSGFGSYNTEIHSNSIVNSSPSSSSSLDCFSCRYSLQSLSLKLVKPTIPPKSVLISCNHSRGRFDPKSSRYDDHDHDYLEASVLFRETISHHHLRKQGFRDELNQKLYAQFFPFSGPTEKSRSSTNLLGFLPRFRSPTIFLKISCEGDFVLPIVVGEFAVEKLIESLQEDDREYCPSQYQFVRNLAAKFGYEVKMVKITERVASTYLARVYFSKERKKVLVWMHVPSDAINVASRCKAPIYVNKEIVLTDAIRLGYGVQRLHDTKPIYDVSLDSAMGGPDPLAEELDLVQNMNLAVKEERYSDAAMWRDKLMKLRESGFDH
ncbi:hypothetical protein Ancab_003112 [Ancistrocladus abbreviatus]